MNKKKAIAIGEYTSPEWHPFTGVDMALKDILNSFELDCTEEYGRFEANSLQNYDLCISFTDHWTQQLNDKQTAGLLSFVANGGGLLAIHNGIAIQNRWELLHLVGAKFTTHPQERELEFRPVNQGHAILEGIGLFRFQEEPYQFEQASHTESEPLLEYESEGKHWPAGWAHKFGMGRVVYLAPGHHKEAFQDAMYRKLIERSALWVVQEI